MWLFARHAGHRGSTGLVHVVSIQQASRINIAAHPASQLPLSSCSSRRISVPSAETRHDSFHLASGVRTQTEPASRLNLACPRASQLKSGLRLCARQVGGRRGELQWSPLDSFYDEGLYLIPRKKAPGCVGGSGTLTAPLYSGWKRCPAVWMSETYR